MHDLHFPSVSYLMSANSLFVSAMVFGGIVNYDVS
jgi:hypothetical protein